MRHLVSAALLTAAVVLPSLASATMISASYQVNLNENDPGLVVDSQDVADNPFSLDLNEGESATFKLFSIWTEESWVNNDDEVPQAISVDFSFTLPEVLGGSVNGETVGYSVLGGFYQEGQLTWDAPLELSYGANNDGLIRVTLHDATFNEGFFGLHDSWCYGAKVKATIELVAEATHQVPEPATVALLGLGLLGMGLRGRRKESVH